MGWNRFQNTIPKRLSCVNSLACHFVNDSAGRALAVRSGISGGPSTLHQYAKMRLSSTLLRVW